MTEVLSLIVLVLMAACVAVLPFSVIARQVKEQRARQAVIEAARQRMQKAGEVA
ncbi:hypothetical protein [Streptomyces sp. NBC_00425]|uniref:hypothetical protein n=1 Tax=Streptomyces sp. NBC_00425 TaxID=2975740 RepID=UPI002E1E9848